MDDKFVLSSGKKSSRDLEGDFEGVLLNRPAVFRNKPFAQRRAAPKLGSLRTWGPGCVRVVSSEFSQDSTAGSATATATEVFDMPRAPRQHVPCLDG